MGRLSLRALLASALSVFFLAPLLALEPSGEPEPTMRTLQEIYDRVEDVDARVEDVHQSVVELEDLREQVSLLREVVESFAIAQGLVVDGWRRSVVFVGGRFASLVYEPDGYPAISTGVLTGSTWRLIVRKFNGQNWTTVLFQEDRGEYSSMAVRDDGYRLVASRTSPPLPQRQIIADMWNGTFWSNEVVQTFDLSGPVDTFSAFAPDGQQLISYYDPDLGRLRMARRVGFNNWSHTTLDNDGDVGRYSSIAVYPDGSIGVSYYDVTNGNLKLAFFDSRFSTWSTQVVDDDGNVGMYSYIAIAPGGRLAVSYHKDASPSGLNSALRYAIRSGQTWEISTVATGTQVGEHTSLAFGQDGQPAISYHIGNAGNLRFARHDGTQWRTYPVDTEGDVGKYSSLAFNPAGRPTIAYHDATNSSLKFAEQVPIATPP